MDFGSLFCVNLNKEKKMLIKMGLDGTSSLWLTELHSKQNGCHSHTLLQRRVYQVPL